MLKNLKPKDILHLRCGGELTVQKVRFIPIDNAYRIWYNEHDLRQELVWLANGKYSVYIKDKKENPFDIIKVEWVLDWDTLETGTILEYIDTSSSSCDVIFISNCPNTITKTTPRYEEYFIGASCATRELHYYNKQWFKLKR